MNNSTASLTLFPGEVSSSLLVGKVQKIIATRKRNTVSRNERIQSVFNHKYNVERKRYDDVIQELCSEFSLARRTIETALKS